MSSVLVGAQYGGRGIYSLKVLDPQYNFLRNPNGSGRSISTVIKPSRMISAFTRHWTYAIGPT